MQVHCCFCVFMCLTWVKRSFLISGSALLMFARENPRRQQSPWPPFSPCSWRAWTSVSIGSLTHARLLNSPVITAASQSTGGPVRERDRERERERERERGSQISHECREESFEGRPWGSPLRAGFGFEVVICTDLPREPAQIEMSLTAADRCGKLARRHLQARRLFKRGQSWFNPVKWRGTGEVGSWTGKRRGKITRQKDKGPGVVSDQG